MTPADHIALAHRVLDVPYADPDSDACTLAREFLHAQETIGKLERLVYVPGLWKCAACNFHLIQSNLNMGDASITARDTPGDKCPNCNSPLWRVSEREDRKETEKLIDNIRNLTINDVLARMGNFIPSPPNDARFHYYEAAVGYCVKAMGELKAEIKGMLT